MIPRECRGSATKRTMRALHAILKHQDLCTEYVIGSRELLDEQPTTSQAASAAPRPTTFDPDMALREDTCYMIRCYLRINRSTDTNDIAKFFVSFLADPELTTTLHNGVPRLAIKPVPDAQRLVHSITTGTFCLFFPFLFDYFYFVEFSCVFVDSFSITAGVDESWVHINKLSIDWALKQREYSESDPFVYKHHVHKSKIEAAVNLVARMRQINSVVRPVVMERMFDWRDLLVSWWNDAAVHFNKPIESLSDEERRFPQCYLWGPSKTGKTSFIRKLLGMCLIFLFFIL